MVFKGQSAFSQILTCGNLRDVFIGAYPRLWMLAAANTARYPISLEHRKVKRNIAMAIIFNICFTKHKNKNTTKFLLQ